MPKLYNTLGRSAKGTPILNFNPKSIEKIDDDAMRITWEDGHVSEYTFQLLRQNCPCAVCKDEWTGERLLDPGEVPATLQASRAEVVGNYALSFGFSDGHGTGIYSFEVLRKLCACEECSYHPGSETN
jgi:DUF971 family protein